MVTFVRRTDETVLEVREEAYEESREAFDRMEFAMDTLRRFCPPEMTVALCRGRSRLRVESGRSWGHGERARWALVSIPPRASREAIVLALTELSGPGAAERHTPYLLDTLLAPAASAAAPKS
jgi:hypothetical protein